jgi:hypothetical protein
MKHIGILAVGAAAILSGCCCDAPSRCGCPPPCAPAPCAPAARAALPPAAAAAVSTAKAPEAPAAVPAAVPTSGPETAALSEVEVRKVLAEKKVRDASFTDASLDDVVAYLRAVTGLTFFVSPTARVKFADAKVNTPKLDEVPAAELLALVTAPSDLRWEVRDGVVWIVTSEEAKPR